MCRWRAALGRLQGQWVSIRRYRRVPCGSNLEPGCSESSPKGQSRIRANSPWSDFPERFIGTGDATRGRLWQARRCRASPPSRSRSLTRWPASPCSPPESVRSRAASVNCWPGSPPAATGSTTSPGLSRESRPCSRNAFRSGDGCSMRHPAALFPGVHAISRSAGAPTETGRSRSGATAAPARCAIGAVTAGPQPTACGAQGRSHMLRKLVARMIRQARPPALPPVAPSSAGGTARHHPTAAPAARSRRAAHPAACVVVSSGPVLLHKRSDPPDGSDNGSDRPDPCPPRRHRGATTACGSRVLLPSFEQRDHLGAAKRKIRDTLPAYELHSSSGLGRSAHLK